MRTFVISALLAVVICIPVAAGNYGHSVENERSMFTFEHESALDSGWVYFSFPADSNYYYSVKLLPLSTLSDDSLCVGAVIDLDSIGPHIVRVVYWQPGDDGVGDTTGVDFGVWVHDYNAFYLGLMMGYVPGVGSREIEGTNYDRLLMISGSDTIIETRFYHIGGPAGGNPDSTRTKLHGDW